MSYSQSLTLNNDIGVSVIDGGTYLMIPDGVF